MVAINYRDLRRQSQAATKQGLQEQFLDEFRENIESGQMKPEDFNLTRLMEELVPDGRELIREFFDPSVERSTSFSDLLESDAIKSSNFVNITGQIMYSAIMQPYEAATNVFTPLIPVVPTALDGEQIPGISGLGDAAQDIGEAEAYPVVGLNEDWIRVPKGQKRGFEVRLTKEAIFFDKTMQLISQASALGNSMGLEREKRAIDCIIDENTTTHRYNRKDRGAVATYGDNSGSHDWDNLQASNALVDWTDVDAMEQLFYALRDPNTGEPINLSNEKPTLICDRSLLMTASRILNNTSIQTLVGGYATSGTTVLQVQDNPMANKFDIVTSPLISTRLGTLTSWFYGRPSRAFVYNEQWPMKVEQAPPNSSEEFHRDIAMMWKASRRGSYATREPRHMTKATAA